MSGCVGLANNPQAPFTSFFIFSFGEGLESPQGLYEPCSAAVFWEWARFQLESPQLFLSFLPFFTPGLNLHLKFFCTWDADFVPGGGRGLCPGSGWRSVHLRRRTPQRLASEPGWNVCPPSEGNGSSSAEPQLSFPCPFEKPLSVNYSATPLVVTRYNPPSPSFPTHMACPSPKFPALTSFGLIYLSQCWQFAASY